MRLWHKDLIPVLPRQQLISQWRECCCIAKNIADNGTPNHMLVNKVLDYHFFYFTSYTQLVLNEIVKRGYTISEVAYMKFMENCEKAQDYFNNSRLDKDDIYGNWHNDRYLNQCFFNLQEKFDCGGILYEEWEKIIDAVYDKVREVKL